MQVKLGDREQADILNELRSTQRLRECLDRIDIIIGFLSSGGAEAKTPLRIYLKKALKMDTRFNCSKVR